jgi:polyisoprenoid-binding protein YceI
MKTISRILIMMFIAVTSLSFSQAQTAYVSSGDPEVTIEGTSNVHDWEEKVETLNGSGMITWNTDGSFNISSVLIKVDCKAIKSTHGSMMDGKTYDALKADKFPTITYKLTTPLVNIKPSPSGIMVNTAGDVTIAGITKPMTMQVKIIGSSSGPISFEGSKTINMTEFKVIPPTALLGAIKVGDVVTVKFKTNFSKSSTNIKIN